eukprot:gnl/MRDRNA2_/MRDRNA2_66965_c0_seq1.p1 gnl/MRDRNA2_/MRDRNA2_66965_c0~~gnl/MRDRNA2_/MRDRNA2_66965_c0_seq1.p1  ORF type:complete len:247 (+),score=46.10 gnl/MRDRNA2_/MRDRNA2_66965_c0_seq1:68-808(+)
MTVSFLHSQSTSLGLSQTHSVDWSPNILSGSSLPPGSALRRSLSLAEHDKLIRRSNDLDWLVENAIVKAQRANTPARIQRYKALYQAFGQFAFDHLNPDSTSFGMSSVSEKRSVFPARLDDEATNLLDPGALGGTLPWSPGKASDFNDSIISSGNIVDNPASTPPRKKRGAQVPSRSGMDWVYHTPPKPKRDRDHSTPWNPYSGLPVQKSPTVEDAIARRAELEREVILLKLQSPPIWRAEGKQKS